MLQFSGLQAICTAYGVEMASVLSEKEGTQIYNIFDVQSTRRALYCSTDSSGVCEYPYIGLKRASGTSNTLLWKPNVKWTDGNSLDFTDWGSGEPDLCKRSFSCLLIFFIHCYCTYTNIFITLHTKFNFSLCIQCMCRHKP